MKTRDAESAKQERDLKLRSLRRRQNAKLALAILLFILVIAIAVIIYNSDFWLISRVEVEGSKYFSSTEILTAARIPTKTSLLKFPGNEIADRLKKSPWIKEVNFSRRLPKTLIIIVSERRPFAVVSVKRDNYLIDSEGYVISRQLKTRNFQAPVINGVNVKKIGVGKEIKSFKLNSAIAILDKLPRVLRNSVTAVSVPSMSKLALYTNDSIEIVYGKAEDMSKKNLVIEKILDSGKGKIIYINVTIPENPVVRKL